MWKMCRRYIPKRVVTTEDLPFKTALVCFFHNISVLASDWHKRFCSCTLRFPKKCFRENSSLVCIIWLDPQHRPACLAFPCRATHMPLKTLGKEVPAAATVKPSTLVGISKSRWMPSWRVGNFGWHNCNLAIKATNKVCFHTFSKIFAVMVCFLVLQFQIL